MNRKKLLLIILAIAVVGAVGAGVIAYINITKDSQIKTIDQDSKRQNTEPEPDVIPQAEEVLVSSGKFEDGDVIHKGEGTAEIVEKDGKAVLEFKDFKVTRGPDVFIYLSPNAADENLGDFVSLGKIKSFDSDHSYNLPKNYQDYKTVVIWCRAFSTTFATAELE